MQRLLDLLNKLSPAEWAVAASGAALAAVLSGSRGVKNNIAYFLSGLLCGLVFPPWIAHFLWKYPENLHLGIVAILSITGYSIVQWIKGVIREKLRDRKLSLSDVNRRKGNDD